MDLKYWAKARGMFMVFIAHSLKGVVIVKKGVVIVKEGVAIVKKG